MDNKGKSLSHITAATTPARRGSITRIPVLVRATPSVPTEVSRKFSAPEGQIKDPFPRKRPPYTTSHLILKKSSSKKECIRKESPAATAGGKISFSYKPLKSPTMIVQDIPQTLYQNTKWKEPDQLLSELKEKKTAENQSNSEQQNGSLNHCTLLQKPSSWSDKLQTLRQQTLPNHWKAENDKRNAEKNTSMLSVGTPIKNNNTSNNSKGLRFKPLFDVPGKASLIDTLIDRYQVTKLNLYLDTDVENLDDIPEPSENFMDDWEIESFLKPPHTYKIPKEL